MTYQEIEERITQFQSLRNQLKEDYEKLLRKSFRDKEAEKLANEILMGLRK